MFLFLKVTFNSLDQVKLMNINNNYDMPQCYVYIENVIIPPSFTQFPKPILSTNLDTTISQCLICGKVFKSKRGLSQHNAIIRKYNTFRNNLYKLSKAFINDFKKTLVFLIHCQLPCHFMKIGMKSVTVACTESQFFAIFSGYIHYYSSKTKVYKCIFRGADTSSKLAQIFNNENWGTKFYGGDEVTLVLTNLEKEAEEENPLDKKRKLLIHSSRTRRRYKRGEVIVEWKPKYKKDIKGNKYEGGFLYIHFWITKRRSNNCNFSSKI